MAKTKAKNKTAEKPAFNLKERLLEKRQARDARKKLIGVISASLFLGIILGLPVALMGELKIAVALGLGLPCFFVSYQYPRLALWTFLIYMPISGTVVYWVLGGNPIFQLAKDVFYIPALIALVQECRRKRLPILIPKEVIPSLILLITFALLTFFFANTVQQFLPFCNELTQKFMTDASGEYILDSNGIVIKIPCKDGIPIIQGLLGLKVLIGYIPLIFCAYYLIEDRKQLLFLGRLLVVIAIVCCALGIVQYAMLYTGRCEGTRDATGADLFKASLDAKCLVGGSLTYSPSQNQIRLPGTFVSPWHWAWFLIGNSAITFTTAFSDPSPLWKIGGLIGMALVMINAVISGQRIALALVPVIIVILLVLTGQITNLKKFIPIAIGLGLIIGIAAISYPEIVQERIESFVGRWNAAPPTDFIDKQFGWAIKNNRHIFGYGLGKATNSARAFGNVALVETFHPKLIYEMGYLGTIAFMIFVTHLSILGFKAYRSLKDKTLRSFASSFLVFLLIIGYFPYWYPLDTDPVCVYYWFLFGVIFKLPVIEKEERKQLKLEQEKTSETSKKTTRRKFKKHSVEA
jgi:hypothetical protein